MSIGGRVESSEGDQLSYAIDCAAALRLTAQRLDTGAARSFGTEIAVITRAEEFFLHRAAQAEPDTTDALVSAAVARRHAEKRAEVGQQAQLAIACLRRFGEAVQARSGDAL